MRYRVETLRDWRWTQDGLGQEYRYTYATRTEARNTIRQFRECGRDWRDAKYRVVKVRDAGEEASRG